MIESMESSIPPRPGIIVPLSLIPADLLKQDSIKSPIQEKIAVANPITKPANGVYRNVLGKMIGANNPAIEGTRIPPMKPAIDLFGLTFTNPLLFFPNAIPKKYANESVPNTNARNSRMIPDAFSK